MKLNQPKVSVIMSCFNSEKYVDYAIKSVIKQDYKNWELLLIDDNSSDSTLKILKKYKSKKVKILALKKNVGQHKAIHLALKKSLGKYIAILDSDDYAHKKRILDQVTELEKNKSLGLIVSRYKIIDERNRFINNSEFISEKEFIRRLPCENICCFSSSMFRKKLTQRLSFYNKEYDYCNDYYFFLKIFSVSKIKHVNKFYTFYRVHTKSRTNTFNKKNLIIEDLKCLEWSRKKGFVNKSNILLYIKNVFKNYIKLFIAVVLKLVDRHA